MTSIFRMLIEGAWRRRMLIIAPIIVLTSLGLAAALLLPRTYESEALILLQEDGGRTALTERAQSRRDEIEARVNAFAALLNSENLLSRVLFDVGAVAPGDDALLAIEIQNLRDQLSIEPVGSQFIALSIRGGDPAELQQLLTTVLTRAFEALLLPTDELSSAPEFLIRQLQRELETARAQYAAFEGDAVSAIALRGLEADRRAASMEAQRLTGAIEVARTALTASVRSVDATREEVLRPSREVARVEALIAELRGAATPDADAIAQAEERLAAYRSLIPDEEALSRLRLDLAEAQRAIAEAERELAASQAIEGRRAELEQRMRGLETQIDAFPTQFRSGSGQSLNILRAPEQMQIIDSPSLPNHPIRGALVILLLGVAGGVAFGCGLALIAEQLDQSVRSADDFEGLVERPALARLPTITPAAIAQIAEEAAALAAPPAPDAEAERAEPTELRGKVVTL